MECQTLSSPSSISSTPPDSHYSLPISKDFWREAEQRIEEMLCTFQPNVISQERRNEVIEYVQRVVGSQFEAELFPFGSVPLRTYLPDGDIDLTVLCHPKSVGDLIRGLCNMVDDRRNDPELHIQDVQIVEAQVKIVKFMVKGIALDLSFNQVAGLGALCFLEQVDRLIGKDHLLKRSIILIKTWCLYESRILGSHNALISTYALEIMVLYIINVFHSSVDGPLAVLYRFLDYYGKFDWEHYCLSIHGPVPISSLPTIVAEPPESDDKLLFGKEFIDNCRELLCSPTPQAKPWPFQVKNLNIVDPLKETNNLGRSVSKGSFFRIKCAFSYGAQKLSKILMLPMEMMGQELENFFRNSLDRNGRGERPDVEDVVPAFGTGRFITASLDGEINCFYNNLTYTKWHCDYGFAADEQSSPQPPSNHQNHGERYALKKLMRAQGGSEVFVPTMFPIQPYFASANSSAVDESGWSKGTGTFIPVMNHHPLIGNQPWTWGRTYAEPSDAGLTMNGRAKISEEEVSEDPKKQESEQLPKSPCLRKTPTISEDQPERSTPQAKEFHHIGTSRDSSSSKAQPLPAIDEKVETRPGTGGSLTAIDEKFETGPGTGGSLTIEMQKEVEAVENTDEMSPAKPYQLEDIVDFPPLSL